MTSIHFENFVNAVRSGKHEDLNCDIAEGHLSAALCHLANISLRTRQGGHRRRPEGHRRQQGGERRAEEDGRPT